MTDTARPRHRPVRDWVGRQAYLRAMVADVRPDDDGCWPWPFRLNSSGYGYIKWGLYQVLVHRVAYELAHGEEPNICRHTCDRPDCFNPNHLLNGSPADNSQDWRVRGTSPHGAAGRVRLDDLMDRIERVERLVASRALADLTNAPVDTTEGP